MFACMTRKANVLRLAEANRNQLRQSITVYGTVYRFKFRVQRSLFSLTKLRLITCLCILRIVWLEENKSKLHK